MHVFLTGANGWIGSTVASELIGAGHTVAGLSRSQDDAGRLRDAGIEPVIGSLADLDALAKAAERADGVIHTAFGLNFSDYEQLSREDRAAIERFGDVYAGSDRPIVVTSGLGVLAAGQTFAEVARPDIVPEYPRASEQTAFALAERGIRASVVRPARSVHGIGERHGFVPMLSAIAREKGFSAFVGDGAFPWPAVHRLDAARVYRLALERGAGGEAYHAVAEGVPFREVAEAIARQANLPVRSIGGDDAKEHFGDLAIWVTGGGAASSDWTRAALGLGATRARPHRRHRPA